MAYCQNCGGQIQNGSEYCLSCGARANIYQPMHAVPNQTVVVNQQQQETTVGGWIGWLLLCSFLPLFGQIIMLCCATDKSAKNYAKANLIFFLIALVLSFLLIIFMGALGASLS